MKRILLVAVGLAVAVPSLAAAQERPGTDPDRVIEFPPEDVDGDRATGRGMIVITPRGRRQRTLVRPRTHFFPELLKSTDGV